MTNSARRKEIKQIVLSTLENYSINKGISLTLPIPIKKIVKMFPNCRLIKYSQQLKLFNCTYKEFLLIANSTDAYVDYDEDFDKYVICYNDLDKNIMLSNRYRWNIAHELGHVLLNHHKNNEKSRVFRNELTDAEYSILEDEADYFASYILSPHAALYMLKIKTLDSFKNICKISSRAAEIRFKEYKKWLRNSKFKEEFDIGIARIFATEKTCTECKNISNPKDTFCSICGNKNFTIGRSKKNMKYDGVEINENGKYSACPICNNEELENTYCHICGHVIENKCTNEKCGHIAKGNARFCSVCGHKTTFLQEKVLFPWDWDPKEVFVNMNSDDLPF